MHSAAFTRTATFPPHERFWADVDRQLRFHLTQVEKELARLERPDITRSSLNTPYDLKMNLQNMASIRMLGAGAAMPAVANLNNHIYRRPWVPLAAAGMAVVVIAAALLVTLPIIHRSGPPSPSPIAQLPRAPLPIPPAPQTQAPAAAQPAPPPAVVQIIPLEPPPPAVQTIPVYSAPRLPPPRVPHPHYVQLPHRQLWAYVPPVYAPHYDYRYDHGAGANAVYDFDSFLDSRAFKTLPRSIQNIGARAEESSNVYVMQHFNKEASFWALKHGWRVTGFRILRTGVSLANAFDLRDINSKMLRRDDAWLHLHTRTFMPVYGML